MRPFTTLATAAVLVSLALSGCDSTKEDEQVTRDTSSVPTRAAADTVDGSDASTRGSLRAYVNEVGPEVEREVRKMFPDMYADFSFAPQGKSTVVFSYTYAEQVAVAEFHRYMESVMGVLEAGAEQTLREMSQYGIDDPKVEFVYINPDGARLGAFTFD